MRPALAAALALLLAGSVLEAKVASVKDMDGQPTFALGVNYAWKDWGRDFSDQGWEERRKRILADLDEMQVKGVRVLRWWVYTDFVDSPLWQKKGTSLRCTGMPPGWVKNFLDICDEAGKRKIRLYPTFSSFDMGRTGMDAVLRDRGALTSFIDKAVVPILKAAGKHPAIFAWDIVNEPEWLVRTEDGGDPNKEMKGPPHTLAALRGYLKAMVKAIHKHAKQPVSVGSAGMKWCGVQYDFYSGLDLDFFDIHYYDWQTPWFNITTMGAEAMTLNPEAKKKPIIIGETMSRPETQYTGPGKPLDHGQMLAAVVKMGYAGYLPWAWTEKPEWQPQPSLKDHLLKAPQALSLPGL